MFYRYVGIFVSIPEFRHRRIPRRRVWLQHGGEATCQTSIDTINILLRAILRAPFYGLTDVCLWWQNPDLQGPLTYQLKVISFSRKKYLKERVYSEIPRNLESLDRTIILEINRILAGRSWTRQREASPQIWKTHWSWWDHICDLIDLMNTK